MEQLINLLAISLPDWSIPWAGIGALFAGLGSLLSGLAAYRLAIRRSNEQKSENGNSDN